MSCYLLPSPGAEPTVPEAMNGYTRLFRIVLADSNMTPHLFKFKLKTHFARKSYETPAKRYSAYRSFAKALVGERMQRRTFEKAMIIFFNAQRIEKMKKRYKTWPK
jgi:hypothetical protein